MLERFCSLPKAARLKLTSGISIEAAGTQVEQQTVPPIFTWPEIVKEICSEEGNLSSLGSVALP